jgi:long-chain-fatty-acid--[acyl-carrier-protein] ligase
VVEHFYKLRGWRWFMDLVGALSLPDMDAQANKWRAKRVGEQLDQMSSALRRGENLLVYPAGCLKRQPLERLGGASLTHTLLQACPEAQVVLVRTTGLWGSQFSRALTGESPHFGEVFWRCAKMLWKNGIFFLPRREVTVEFEVDPAFPKTASRIAMNQSLEQWYNLPGEEPLQLVSFAFWKEELPLVEIREKGERGITELPVPPQIATEVRQFLSGLAKQSVEGESLDLSHDLGLDSLDLIQIYAFLDQHYDVRGLEMGSLRSVGDVMQAAVGGGKSADLQEKTPLPPFSWGAAAPSRTPTLPEGKTLQEVFLRSMDRGGSSEAAADRVTGELSYRSLKMRALLLASHFRTLPGEHIAVMLPSSIAAYLTIMGVLLAGKVPVLLNWTVGSKALDHALALTGVQTVLTSMKFLDRLGNEDLGAVESCLTYLEDVKEELSLKQKMVAALLQWLPASCFRLSQIAPEKSCVILFTSGTEALPKAVPLSHNHLLSNQRASLLAFPLKCEDILYGVLPPFHSFGFSVTGLFPLFAGIRVVYAPDPTDSHGLAEGISRYKPTLFFSAPSFIRSLFHVAQPHQLSSLRLIVSGAEKTPQELFDYVAHHLPHAHLMEGYGITECSPIVSINREGEPHQGVGRVLPGTDVVILDPETGHRLPAGEDGEIQIAGPSVFDGYLGPVKQPFAVRDGRRWLISGDRGHFTPDGHLVLVGRAKRFVKIGGEMVGLTGLEEELTEWAREQSGVSLPLAVSMREGGERPILILFTTSSLSLDEVNRGLKQRGFGRIVKIDRICQMKEIPLSATGKIDYRFLDTCSTD